MKFKLLATATGFWHTAGVEKVEEGPLTDGSKLCFEIHFLLPTVQHMILKRNVG